MLLPLYASLFRALFAHTQIRCATLTHWCVGRNKRSRKINLTNLERDRYWCATHSKRVLTSARPYIVCLGLNSLQGAALVILWCGAAFSGKLSFFLSISYSLFPSLFFSLCLSVSALLTMLRYYFKSMRFYFMLESSFCFQRSKCTFNAKSIIHGTNIKTTK